MHKAKRIYFDGNGPFSSINTFTTTIGMANYYQMIGRSEMADVLMRDLFYEKKNEVALDEEKGEI